jgi:hypothetical protein
LNSRKDQLDAFNRLLDIMDDLREKCPWDQKQTFESLRHLTIEETYELSEAILSNELNEIKNELLDNRFEILDIWKDHIFIYDIENYKNRFVNTSINYCDGITPYTPKFTSLNNKKLSLWDRLIVNTTDVHKILKEIEDQVEDTCCAVTMDPEDIKDLITKLRKAIHEYSKGNNIK